MQERRCSLAPCFQFFKMLAPFAPSEHLQGFICFPGSSSCRASRVHLFSSGASARVHHHLKEDAGKKMQPCTLLSVLQDACTLCTLRASSRLHLLSWFIILQGFKGASVFIWCICKGASSSERRCRKEDAALHPAFSSSRCLHPLHPPSIFKASSAFLVHHLAGLQGCICFHLVHLQGCIII